MGIITALLVAGGHKEWTTGNFQLIPGQHHEIALWIILACHALGTMSGGWRIVKTMGSRITPHLRPVGGFSAECAAATSIAFATFANTPISTTHAIGGSVAGAGATCGLHAVRWQWGQKIVWAWVLTFPGAAIIGALFYVLAHQTIERFIPAMGAG